MDELEAFEGLMHRMDMREQEVAKARLRKLSVVELRVMHRHYFKRGYAGELSKAELIVDLASEVVADGRL